MRFMLIGARVIQVLLESFTRDIVLIFFMYGLSMLERFFRHVALHKVRVVTHCLNRVWMVTCILGGVQEAPRAINHLQCLSDIHRILIVAERRHLCDMTGVGVAARLDIRIAFRKVATQGERFHFVVERVSVRICFFVLGHLFVN